MERGSGTMKTNMKLFAKEGNSKRDKGNVVQLIEAYIRRKNTTTKRMVFLYTHTQNYLGRWP